MLTAATNMFRNDNSTHNSKYIYQTGAIVRDINSNLNHAKVKGRESLSIEQFGQVSQMGSNLQLVRESELSYFMLKNKAQRRLVNLMPYHDLSRVVRNIQINEWSIFIVFNLTVVSAPNILKMGRVEVDVRSCTVEFDRKTLMCKNNHY